MSMHSKMQEVSEATPLMASYRSVKRSEGAYDISNRKGSYTQFPIKELPTTVVDDLSGLVIAPDGSTSRVRALLDSASSASFITECLTQCLRYCVLTMVLKLVPLVELYLS